MTPKEKAKELIDKYLRIEDNTFFYWEGYWDRRMADDEILPHAKKCALMAVDEIIKFGNQAGIREPMMYWHKVQEEIDKL